MLYDLIIIGGGPAGVTAGIYAARKKMRTLLITMYFGGWLSKTAEIDNYPGFPDIKGETLARKMEKHLKKFDIEVREDEEVVMVEKEKSGFLVKTSEDNEFRGKTVIVATGGHPRKLGIPGEEEYISRGVSYCSVCDAPLFRDKSVAVIGGGNSGLEAVIDLIPYAKKIIVLEKDNKLVSDEILQEKALENSKVKLYLNKEIREIIGNRMVEAIRYEDTETGKRFQVPVDGVFIQIGLVPATSFLNKLVQFNERGEIMVDFATCKTSVPGLFAAGDANNSRWKQIIIAAGEGARACLEAYSYLKTGDRRQGT